MAMTLEGMNTARMPSVPVQAGTAEGVQQSAPVAPGAVVDGPGVVVSEKSSELPLPRNVDAKVLSAMIDSAYQTMRHIAENMGVSKEEAELKAERAKQREKAENLKDALQQLQADMAEKKISAEVAYVRLQGLLSQDDRLLSDAQALAGTPLPV